MGVNTSSIAHLVVRPFGLQRVGQAQAADHDVGLGGAAAVELVFHVLAFAQERAFGQQRQFFGHVLAVQVRRADLGERHAEFARQKTRQRNLELRIGEEEDAFAGELRALAGHGGGGAVAGGGCCRLERGRVNAEGRSRRLQPGGGALHPQRKRGRQPGGAARLQRHRRVGQERLGQQKHRVGADRRHLVGLARREKLHRADAQLLEQAGELVFDHVGQRAHHHQRQPGHWRPTAGRHGHQRGQAGVFALGEGGLDAAARVIEHAHVGRKTAREARGGARQIQLDDLGRAGAHQKQQLDLGPALDQAGDDPVELFVAVGQAGQIALVDDGGGKTRLGKDHHAGGGLDQVGAGARADHQEKRVLDLAVQPDDAGEAAEHLALAPLLEHGRVSAALGHRLDGNDRAHAAALEPAPPRCPTGPGAAPCAACR